EGIVKWSGLVDGFEGHPVDLVRSGSNVFGKVVHGDHVYVIQNVSSSLIAVQEVDRVAPAPCGNDGSLSVPNVIDHGPVAVLPSFARTATIDVMVAYTEEAKLGAGLGIPFIGDIMIELQIELAVLEMNNALRRSDVRHRVRLVHTMEVDGSDIENEESRDQLYWIRDRMNDNSDSIHAAREAYNADIVSLWVEESDGACGRGFVYNLSSDFAERATHMVVRSCQIKKYSFLHEFGHNLGGNHDWAVSTTDMPYIYSHGYALWDVNFPMIPVRTLMAYDDICEYVGVNCPRIPVFSNPDYEILGHPLGIEYADVHRTINNTGYAISRFR
ncbi:MAG: zinc-dependent metalloprotease family protein, partial [Myxococcota bacterium]|nr:zinc-dependent metalloprotease family protein [Myxococcota bacterium]